MENDRANIDLNDREKKYVCDLSTDELVLELHARCTSFVLGGFFHAEGGRWLTASSGDYVSKSGLLSELGVKALEERQKERNP